MIDYIEIAITDRRSWLAYRADWRVRYAKASEAVRSAKRTLHATYAAGDEASCQQASLHYQRVAANKLMIELNKAKDAKTVRMAEADKQERPVDKAA